MKTWTEFDIGIVYFAGLAISLITSILTVLYLRPFKATIKKITGKFETIWNSSFKTTVVLGGLLGAMSVTFKNCHGNYDYLLESKKVTVMKGLKQVSTSFDWLIIVLGFWLVIFIILRLTSNKKNKKSPAHNNAS
jgi:hypothetical protein